MTFGKRSYYFYSIKYYQQLTLLLYVGREKKTSRINMLLYFYIVLFSSANLMKKKIVIKSSIQFYLILFISFLLAIKTILANESIQVHSHFILQLNCELCSGVYRTLRRGRGGGWLGVLKQSQSILY